MHKNHTLHLKFQKNKSKDEITKTIGNPINPGKENPGNWTQNVENQLWRISGGK